MKLFGWNIEFRSPVHIHRLVKPGVTTTETDHTFVPAVSNAPAFIFTEEELIKYFGKKKS